MKMNDAFPSRFMKADDLEEGDVVLTISHAEFEEFTDPKTKRPDNKPVLHFREKEAKPLVLNKTNYRTISQLLGSDDTDDWDGKKIALYATEVESFGEMMLSIRVRLKAPQKAAAASAGKAPAPRPTELDTAHQHATRRTSAPAPSDDPFDGATFDNDAAPF